MNSITFFALLFSLWSGPAVKTAHDPQPAGCQSYNDPALNLTVYTSVEKKPEYPGGTSAWGQFVNKNLIEANLDPAVDCNVKIKMIIDATGAIKKAVPVRGDVEVKEPNANEKEVVRVYLKSGAWVPGQCGGNNVAAEYVESFTPCIK
ncbi:MULTISPECIES: hypothetical protein [Niastella]|uniref:Uncharacterized protein n=1 Tax=Niastella soli TaxID=2821487 RepID=A0ABS3Z2V4_9BACT|nr:hypothetical protein [Niastella soli]MBO9204502.1 hypothetical protein [Niastella soli]